MEAMNVYQFQYSAAHFDEAFTTFQIAPTAGKAKSEEFRSFTDYDSGVKYLDFSQVGEGTEDWAVYAKEKRSSLSGAKPN